MPVKSSPTSKTSVKVLLWILLLALVGSGLWALDYYQRRSEKTLLARANRYWEAVRLNDFRTAFELEAEARAGTLLPHQVETFQDWGVRLVGFQLGSIIYYADHAEIELSQEVTRPDSKTKTKTKPMVKDLWTFMNGAWYHGSPEKGSSGLRKSRHH